jgi:glycosyltransferase involved in cell wall biosynthesis
MPFRVGGGTRLKLIEAMASDLAIASTTVGAEGFELQSGKQLLLADTPSDFGDAILTLLDDREYRQELSREARKFADQYDWRQVSPRFYKIIDKLLETN